MYIDAGAMRDRIEVLALAEGDNGFRWDPVRRYWCRAELTGKTCLFSKVGIGARAVELTMRALPIGLHHAIRWNGQHLFLQEITCPERGWLRIQAAVVEVGIWTANRFRRGIDPNQQNRPVATPLPPLTFPGVITEKYMGYQVGEAHVTKETAYVLVTPKPVVLSAGDTVSNLDTVTYRVQVAHTLDPWKNEYEVVRKESV